MKPKLLFAGLCLCTIITAQAQTNKRSALFNLVTSKQQNGAPTGKRNLFSITDTMTTLISRASSVVSKFAVLQIDEQTASSIFTEKAEGLTLSIPYNDGKVYMLRLVEQKINSDGNFSFGSLEGDHVKKKLSADAGLHYRGFVDGDSTSIASFSFFANGRVMGLFANKEGNFTIGKAGHNKNGYIIYNSNDLLVPRNISCGVTDDQVVQLPSIQGNTAETAPSLEQSLLCSKVRLYWEGDYELYSIDFNSNLTDTRNYLEGLFNQVATIYQNEDIMIEASEIYVWTTADPYRNSSSSYALADFKSYWNSKGDDFGADLAHLLSGGTTNNGGLAYLLGNFCGGKSFAYGYSNVYASYQEVPIYSWDVEVVSHETGHNFGSHHTHWCGWNTGAGGACGAIDNCYTLESAGSCSTCPATTDITNPPAGWKGTIMSYCHLTSLGINLANGFGPLPGDLIRNNVTAATGCLSSIISARVATTHICNTSDGEVSAVLNDNDNGTSPYTYLWTPGNYTTKKVSNLSTPGTYSVSITDQNGCSTDLSAELKSLGNPGSLIPLSVAMPVCCAAGSDSITIKTTAPVKLGECETVAWLRSPTPITTYSEALTAFNDADSGNIFFSTNSDVSNGATLKVVPPASCSSDSTWYYVAFVSKKSNPATVLTKNSVYGGNVVIGSPQVVAGSFVTIASQTSSIPTCKTDAAPAITLTATVTAYTGRANKLTIQVQSSTGAALVTLSNLAGAGTYDIPAAALGNAPLAWLSILAYDYNCSGNSCTASSVTFTAKRTVTYEAITQPTFEEACDVSGAATVSFSSNTGNCLLLPVAFKDFDLGLNNCIVSVKWKTSAEFNNNYFSIERSSDGQHFTSAGTVKPATNNGGTGNYSFTDNLPLQGKNYYRITQYDLDGRSSSTEIKTVDVNCLQGKNIVKLFPNPAHTTLYIQSIKNIKKVEVINTAGQAVLMNATSTPNKLDLKKIAAGAYICRITFDDDTSEHIKFIKN